MYTIYHNGHIYVEKDRFVEAMLVSDGVIEKIGTLSEVTDGLCPKCERETVDLGGATVIPGLNDSHLHLANVGSALSQVILGDAKSVDDLVRLGKEFIERNGVPRGGVLLGRGWNQDYFTDEVRMPTRYDLDRISTEIPIVYTRACGHISVSNSKALELAGITADTEAVPGGVIYRDENGEPNGLISENAQRQIQAIIPPVSAESIASDINIGMAYAASHGLTSLQTNDLSPGEWKMVIDAYKLVYANNPNALRVYEQSNVGDIESVKEFFALGHTTNSTLDGVDSDMFRFGPLKLFVDGSLGARTALMRKPYADDPSTVGVSTIPQQDFTDICLLADANNTQVVTHCIGDGAIELVLNGYEAAINTHPEKGNVNRHAGIHVQITDNAMLERFKALDVGAQVQPIFIHYDMNVVADRVGEELAAQSYAFGDLYRMGVHTSYGTDSPVEDLNTMNNLYCAVTRKRLDGEKIYRPDQQVDISDAIDMYTIHSAYASFDENRKGRLMPGYLADFAVLDRDIFSIPLDEIKEVKVTKTVLGGKVIFER